MKFGKVLGTLMLILLLAAVGALVFLRVTGGSLSNPFTPPAPDMAALLADYTAPAADAAATPAGQLLLDAAQSTRRWALAGEPVQEGKTARQSVSVTVLDAEKLSAAMREAQQAAMRQRVDTAARAAEIYENGVYRPELLEATFRSALEQRLQSAEDCASTTALSLNLSRQKGQWQIENLSELDAALLGGGCLPADAAAETLFNTAAEALPYLPLHYTIEETALAGPAPNAANYGVTDDPAVIEALLQRPEAQTLIDGQELCWNAQIARFPNTPIRYYLDETLLVLVWQEVEAHAVGTFSEVFVADGLQLRRKIAGDTPFDFNFETCSQFALDTNAVLALGGDFYHHGRACGISVYQREICRFEPETCDVCYITPDGDMLFSYRGQFASEEEARQFIADNDVLFSLVFGPVLIDNGVDVTPESYAWGEVNDTYARSALGLLGRHHYLTMNINCGQGEYYYLATLRQAADAMIARGCVKAYTLDGGQTATTVFGGQLINPVQFGWEKPISDIIYFATALPEE